MLDRAIDGPRRNDVLSITGWSRRGVVRRLDIGALRKRSVRERTEVRMPDDSRSQFVNSQLGRTGPLRETHGSPRRGRRVNVAVAPARDGRDAGARPGTARARRPGLLDRADAAEDRTGPLRADRRDAAPAAAHRRRGG